MTKSTDLEPILKVALSLHNSPGVYALLLGSGLSRSAGIPTGWEITLDLIGKLAAMKGEDVPDGNREAWYLKRFGEQPDYSKLLDRLTSTPTERMTLLRSYIEPTDEQREQGLKMPTAAHRAIANLVKLGYVRMILTTNFDRLLEMALEEAGISPDIVKSDDDLKGSIPYVHSKCYLVKLHGDYRDTRIKNTPEELENYSEPFNQLLDQVLDQFGLIVCGWSGAWDTALRKAILRCPNRRFPMYWLNKGALTEEVEEIIRHRRAEAISIEGADQFFTSLLEKIQSLQTLNRVHPLSTAVAVETVKRCIVDPASRIRLHDLIREETEQVYQQLTSERFSLSTSPTKELFQDRMRQYEAIVERLTAMLTALSYYDAGNNSHLLTHCIERLASWPTPSSYYQVWFDLQYYPALLLEYAAGISALSSRHFQNLAAVLCEPKYLNRSRDEKSPAIEKLNAPTVFSNANKWVPLSNAEQRHTPESDYLSGRMRSVLKDYLPDDTKYEETFDVFEYILGLTYLDLVDHSLGSPVGRFGWRYGIRRFSPIDRFVDEGLRLGENWELLKAGFFRGSVERFNEIMLAYQECVQNAARRWLW